MRDHVSVELANYILARDRRCVVRWLDQPASAMCSGRLTLDHVKDQSRMGKRAPSDERHLVTLCEFHHLGSKGGANWATSHRGLLRSYLATVEHPLVRTTA